jgi:hypothetical protein
LELSRLDCFQISDLVQVKPEEQSHRDNQTILELKYNWLK